MRALSTAEEFRAFVDAFWLRRDPTPGTPANEYRAEFLRRVDSAGRQFAETTKPGWKTDRGKIYVLLGPPDEISSQPMASGRRGVAVWIYRSAPQADLGPQVVVRFAQDGSGEYRLTADAFADSQVVRLGAAGPMLQPLPGPPVAEPDSELANRIRHSRLQDVPVPMPVPQVLVSWSAHGSPFRSCASFYLSGDGSTLTALTLEAETAFLRQDPDFRAERIRALGYLARQGTAERFDLGRLLPETEPAGSRAEGPLRFQALRALFPGRYRAYFALVDERDRLRGSYHEDLEVPALPQEALTISSLTLVEELGEVRSPGREPLLEPFSIGHLRVVPRCRRAFAAGEEMGLYYQIYDAGRGNAAEMRPLDIEYRMEILLENESYAVGPPLRLTGQTSRVQGQVFPLAGWPPGRYRLLLSVRDPAGGARAARDIDFEVR